MAAQTQITALQVFLATADFDFDILEEDELVKAVDVAGARPCGALVRSVCKRWIEGRNVTNAVPDVRRWANTLADAAQLPLQLAWDALHGDEWRNVDHSWRLLYGLACRVRAGCLALLEEYEKAAKLLDVSLMITGPRFQEPTFQLIGQIQAILADEGSSDSMCCAKWIENGPAPAVAPREGSIAIRRVANLALDDFRESYMKTRTPVILTGDMHTWPAVGERSPDRCWRNVQYLKRVAGYRTVPVEVGATYMSEDWGQVMMPFGEFIDTHIMGTRSHHSCRGAYLAQHPLFDQIPELRKDIMVPDYCCLREREDVDETDTEVRINAWFGRNTVSCNHTDPLHNLLCQVVGHKVIRLYHPKYSDCMYPHEGMMNNTSQVDPDSIDTERFPKFASAPYSEFVLSPGEMLYIPPMFWHYIKAPDVSFSVSFWWDG